MPSRVRGLQFVVLCRLFAYLDRLHQQLAVSIGAAAASFIERELGCDQIGAVLGQPLRAIECIRGFLAAGERQFDGAFGLVVTLLEAAEHIHPGGIHRLHIGCAAAVEIAPLFDQGKGIASPIFAFGLHHIQMAEQQHGFGALRGTCEHRH